MCHNYGRPTLFSPDELVPLGRDFINHPLATCDDTRNIAILEVNALRSPFLHAVSRSHREDMQSLIPRVMEELSAWEERWLTHYGKIGPTEFG